MAGAPKAGSAGLQRWRSPERPPILALHGFTGDAQDFACLADASRDALDWWALDLPGHGNARVESPEQLTLEDFLQAIESARARIEAETGQRPHLLGYSMGGRIALHAAKHHPAAWRTLITIGATPGIAEPARRMDRLIADEDLAARMRRQTIDEFLQAWQAMPIIRSQDAIAPRILNAMRARRRLNDPQQLAGALMAVSSGRLPSLWDELDQLDLPYLIMAGQADQKFATIAHKMAPLLPRPEVCLLAKAGHCAHLESPDEFLMLLRGYLREQA